MTDEEIIEMVLEEERRLGVGSEEFRKRHDEIMSDITAAMKERRASKMLCAKIDVITAAMANSCLSPQEIAGKAGVSVNIIYRIRKGYLVKMDSFGKVCRMLGLDCKDVIDFERVQQYREKVSG